MKNLQVVIIDYLVDLVLFKNNLC